MFGPSVKQRTVIAAALIAACAAFAARADEFSWQLSGGMRRVDASSTHMDSWSVDATYYMKPIDDSAGPYALASFLNPTTRVSATASQSDSLQSAVDDPTAYTLSGDYVLPGEKWYVGADYAKSHVDDLPPTIISDPVGYGVEAGRYLGANTTLALRLGRSEQKSTVTCQFSVTFCAGLPVTFESTNDSVGLEVFHVRRFRSLTYTLQGRVSQTNADVEARSTGPLPIIAPVGGATQRVYSVATELFPTNRLGVRVGYSRPDSAYDVDGYDVTATWFFRPRVAVQFGLSRTTFDASFVSGHSESAGVRFIGRL